MSVPTNCGEQLGSSFDETPAAAAVLGAIATAIALPSHPTEDEPAIVDLSRAGTPGLVLSEVGS